MAEDFFAYPDDYTTRSIRDGFSIGMTISPPRGWRNLWRTPAPQLVVTRPFPGHMIIAGPKTSGVDTMLTHLMASTLLCDDALAWLLTEDSDHLARLWMSPFALAEAKTPALDRLALTGDAAREAVEHLVAIVKDRLDQYQPMMTSHDTSLLPVGNGREVCRVCGQVHPPAIVLFVAGIPAKARDGLNFLMHYGESVGVMVVAGVRDPYANTLPVSWKKAATTKIGMGALGASLLNVLFGDEPGAAVGETFAAPGQAYLRAGADPVLAFNGWMLTVPRILDIAKVAGGRRPQLEQAAIDLGGDVYAGRWKETEMCDYLDRVAGRPAV